MTPEGLGKFFIRFIQTSCRTRTRNNSRAASVRVCVDEPDFRYSKSPVKPGVEFWGSILSHRSFAQAASAVRKMMTFQVADTFIINESGCSGFVWKKSSMILIEDVSPDEMLLHFDLRDNIDPSGVRKRIVRGCSTQTSTVAIASSTIVSVVRASYDCDDYICLQKFVKRIRPSVDSVKVLRVSFSTAKRVCQGELMVNGPCASGLSEDTESLTEIFCVNATFGTKVTGNFLSTPTSICQKMVYFIENYFAVRLDHIVIDMIPRNDTEFVVIQVKSFQLNSISAPTSLLPYSAMRLQVCSICRSPKSELPRTTTSKLIRESLAHLETRSSNLIRARPPAGGFVKCCETCYALVMNEQELMKIERVFRAASSKGGEMHVTNAKISSSSTWRILVAFERLLDIPPDTPLGCPDIRVSFLDRSVTFRAPFFYIFEIPLEDVDFIDQIINVSVATGAVTLSGTVSGVLDKLLSSSLFGSGASLTSFRVYLGKGKSSVELTLGLENITTKSIRPLPDCWMDYLSKRKRMNRVNRRRSLP